MDLQSSMLLETLRQTPSIQDSSHLDSGGNAGDGNLKSTSSSSLSSSADGGGNVGGVGLNSDGASSEKSALEAMDPAILSASAPSGMESPDSGSNNGRKSNRTRYSINQLLALRNVNHSKQKPIFMIEPKSEKLARMFSVLDRATDRYGKSLTMGKTSDTAFEDDNGGGNGPTGNYGRNRVANGSGGGNSDTGPSGGSGRMEMRRSGGMDLRDPKDRLRKEDGIVLSPQRRSFNMGCQMPAAPSANAGGLSIGGGLLRNERDLLGGRERRIGSGRILSRDVSWDYRPDKDAPESNDYRASANNSFRERDIRDIRENRETRDSRERNDRDKEYRKDFDRDREDRPDRRSFTRDFDRNDNKDSRNNRMSSRYSNSYNSNNDSHGGNNFHSNNYNNHYHSSHHDRRRLYSDHNRDEEPEWFSEPTCQTDTIELRGFDDPVSEEETAKSDKEDVHEDPKHDRLEIKQSDRVIQRPSSSLQQDDRNNNADDTDLLLPPGRTGKAEAIDKANDNHQLRLPNDPSAATAAAAARMDRTPGDGASEGSTKTGLGSTSGIASTIGPSKINDDDFNFDDFLNLDALPSSLLYPELPDNKDSGNTSGSRFSQWFRQDNAAQSQSTQPSGLNPEQQQSKQLLSHFNDSRRSSLQDELNNMINDFTSTGLDDHIPDTNSNKYFAPISPAASTSTNSLMELFQRGDKHLQQQQQQQQQHHHHQQQQHHHPQQHREREHHPQQQIPPPQPPVHSHGGHPLLNNPPSQQLGLHNQHQQQQQQHHQQIQNRNLQQLLGVSGSGNVSNHGPHGPIPPAPSGGQIHSVEELEARFRQSDGEGNNRSAPVAPTIPRLITPSSGNGGNVGGAGHLSNDAQQQEMNAFKKLLAQISENQPHNVQPNPTSHPPHGINMLHHQQQQNELLQKMLHLNQMHHPVNDVRQAEILKRPEAQALLHGVARGEVSQHNLWQQLTNPATAQPHREILTSVLSTINTSPRVVSPNILIQPSPAGVPILPPATVPPTAAVVAAAAAANSANLLFQHHSKQQMRLSPLPNGMPQRIPSPRELQYHTQSIMQNALIRKKLEEQRENYRKRQEQQQQQQHNRNQPETSAASSSAASSTTTSTTTSGGNSSAASSNQPQSGNQVASSTASSAPTTVVPSPALTTPVVASSIASPAKQTPPSHSHSQHTSSPTPLAFTPTSVLRKMTAEKETDQMSINNSSSNASHSAISSASHSERPPLGTGGHGQNLLMGMNNPLSQQQQHQQRNLASLIGSHPPLQPPPPLPHHHMGNAHHPNSMGPQNAQPPQQNHQQMRGGHQPPGMQGGNIPWNLKQPHPGQQIPPMPKPQGRPILKGGNSQQQPPQQQQHPSAMSQMSFASNLEFQQQLQQFQGRSGNPILGAHQSQQQQQQQMLQQQPHNQHQNQMNPHLQQLLQQRQQQQQRAIRNQHMQQMPPSFRMGPQQQQQQSQGPHPHQGQPQPGGSGIINYNRDGGLSPTSNQLARWFSPELLAQASAGKLPSLNIGQAMSLEEFERNMQHSSTTVHN